MSTDFEAAAHNQGIGGRRGETRFTFNASQRIAPCAGDELPLPDDFVEVRCYDLSRKGFSFLLPQPPTFNMLVAELTLPSQQLYVRARVAHITGMAIDGTYQFQVGCEFCGRVEFRADA